MTDRILQLKGLAEAQAATVPPMLAQLLRDHARSVQNDALEVAAQALTDAGHADAANLVRTLKGSP